MAKRRPTRTKRKSASGVRAISDDAVLRSIIADVRRLERHRETELRQRMRDVDKLSTARKPASARRNANEGRANGRRIAQVRHRLHDAQLECVDVVRLRRDIEGIIDHARTQLSALEIEVTVAMNAALARYVATRATRGAPAKPPIARTERPDFATELVKAKYATAITIADRNKMREVLALLTADPERAAEADEWRRELAVQEATVAHLKQGLGLLAAKGPRG